MATSRTLKLFQLLASLKTRNNLRVLKALITPSPPPLTLIFTFSKIRSTTLIITITASKSLKESLKYPLKLRKLELRNSESYEF